MVAQTHNPRVNADREQPPVFCLSIAARQVTLVVMSSKLRINL